MAFGTSIVGIATGVEVAVFCVSAYTPEPADRSIPIVASRKRVLANTISSKHQRLLKLLLQGEPPRSKLCLWRVIGVRERVGLEDDVSTGTDFNVAERCNLCQSDRLLEGFAACGIFGKSNGFPKP